MVENAPGFEDRSIHFWTYFKLWNARTKYIGDNSAVGKLIGLLPVPEGLQYDHFKLHTSEQPYSMEDISQIILFLLHRVYGICQ